MYRTIHWEELWFDVGFKRYTTSAQNHSLVQRLWFDVGFKRYTTFGCTSTCGTMLWFDVGFKRYTTIKNGYTLTASCGLM